jgi:hypothetical protein
MLMAEVLSDLASVRPTAPRFDTNNGTNKKSADAYPDGDDMNKVSSHPMPPPNIVYVSCC